MAIRTYWGVVTFVLGIMLIALVGTWVSIQINYAPEVREFVASRAMKSASLITLPLAGVAGVMLRRSTLLAEELQRIVSRDRLTDAATRDFFFDTMAQSPDAYGVSLVVDIDHFKRVNDTYGHLAGDTVIRRVADILRDNCADRDIVCRFGGEEFVVFLEGAERDRGARIADRILRQAEEAKIFDDNRQIKITVSIGGSLKDTMADIEACISAADKALYRAKSAGRNRAIMDWAPRAE